MPVVKNGYYYISYRDPITKQPKQISTKLKATKDNLRFAKERERAFKEMLKQQPKITDEKLKLSELLYIYGKIKKLKSATFRSYRLAVKTFAKFCGDLPITTYTKQHYSQFLASCNGQGLSQNTIAIHTRSLYALFKYAYKQEIISKIIIEPLKSDDKPIEIIPINDLNIIFDELKKNKRLRHAYYFLKLALETGFRVSTLVSLKWDDIDWGNEIIYVPNIKGDRLDYFPLTSHIIEILEEYGIKETGKLFPYKSTDSLKFFYRLMKKLGMNYHLHQFRKTAITTWVNNNLSIFDVKTLAMHTDVKVTMKYYAKADMQRLKEALEGIKDKDYKKEHKIIKLA